MFVFEGFLAGRTMIFRRGVVNRKFGGAQGPFIFRSARSLEGFLKNKNG
jgi:hypothetical protein